jgi:predicted permease
MNIVGLLYREVHYRVVQKNPVLKNNPYKYNHALKLALSPRRGLTYQLISYFIFGIFSALGILFISNIEVISTFIVFLSIIPFIFAVFITSVQGSNVVYMGVFEPLKSLPLRLGSKFLSFYLLCEILPSLGIVIPASIVILIEYPVAGVLSILWFLMGIFLGHILGLVILAFFGLKIKHRAGKGELVVNIIRAILFFLFFGIFYAFIYMQNYIKEHSGEWSGLIGRYSIIFPFSSGTIFHPLLSTLLLILYISVSLPIYYLLIQTIWNRIMEPRIVFGESEVKEYKIKKRGIVSALMVKDMKILIRRTALLAGFLITLYIVFPQIFMVISTGNFPLRIATVVLLLVGAFSAGGIDAILKIDINSIDFLRTLPLRKKDYVLGKIASMCVVPWSIGLFILSLALYYNGPYALILLPDVFVLPFIASSIFMLYYFHYKEEDIGIPDLRKFDMLILFLILMVIMGIISIPLFFHNIWMSEVIAVTIFSIILFLLRK